MENDKEKLESTPIYPWVGRWKINHDKCTTCCECIDVCRLGLLYLKDNLIMIKNEHLCTQCGKCQDICGAHAIILT